MARCFHFNIGDSNTSALGLCATIIAESDADALAKLQDVLRKITVDPGDEPVTSHELAENYRSWPESPMRREEYVTLYVNGDFITTDDVDDEWEPDDTPGTD